MGLWRQLSEIIKQTFNIKVIGSCRQTTKLFNCNVELRPLNLEHRSKLDELLSGIDIIIHTAGIAHDLKGARDQDLKSYFDINANATLDLAKSAK